MMPRSLFTTLRIANVLGLSIALAPSKVPLFDLHIDGSTLLTVGSVALPPMTQVPCTGPLKSMIKPPNVDDLYDWYLSMNMPENDPSWAVLWPTAVTLTHYLSEHPSIVKDKSIVELGSGLALCGLVSSALGAKSVLISDREPYALHCALSTASINNFCNIQAAVVDWTDESSMVDASDVVIASDVLYDKETIKSFGKACKRIAVTNGGIVLVVDPKIERTPGARDLFRSVLGDDVKVEIVDLPLPECNFPSQTVDGKDHARRMQEPTVLIKCTL